MGFSVEAAGKKFVYSGDAGICDELTALTRNADLLLHWCYRLSIDTVHPAIAEKSPSPALIARMAANAGVKRLVITHFRMHMDSPESCQSALRDLAEHFPGQAEIAEDLKSYSV
jgi:ribonuclease BN (tRNA processing enzyme)